MHKYTDFGCETVKKILEESEHYEHLIPPFTVGSIIWKIHFKNCYGLSIIKNEVSRGHENDLWEAAILSRGKNGDWKLDYTTPITDGVMGYLNDNDIMDLIDVVKALKSKNIIRFSLQHP